jgi:hypothetical protein
MSTAPLQNTVTKSQPLSKSAHTGLFLLLQRKCACGGASGLTGECEECRMIKLRRKTLNPEPGAPNDSAVPPIVHKVLRSPGHLLDPATRASMQPRFGHDFSSAECTLMRRLRRQHRR